MMRWDDNDTLHAVDNRNCEPVDFVCSGSISISPYLVSYFLTGNA